MMFPSSSFHSGIVVNVTDLERAFLYLYLLSLLLYDICPSCPIHDPARVVFEPFIHQCQINTLPIYQGLFCKTKLRVECGHLTRIPKVQLHIPLPP